MTKMPTLRWNMPMSIYIIGSLRNPGIPIIASRIRQLGYEVFDDWYAAGPKADDHWRDYEQGRGRSYAEALKGHAARHVFDFDQHHLDRCDGGLLVLPAGKSGHLELGYLRGQKKPTWILMDGPPPDGRWDVMYQFASEGVYDDLDMLCEAMEKEGTQQPMYQLEGVSAPICAHCQNPIPAHKFDCPKFDVA